MATPLGVLMSIFVSILLLGCMAFTENVPPADSDTPGDSGGNPAPAISSIAPTEGTTEGGTVVTINGANFQSGARVNFGSSAAASVSFVSATQLRATTRPSTAGTVTVEVINPDGKKAIHNGFTFKSPRPPAPSITSISPTSGSTAGGTVVTINGANFQSGARVSFGNVAATSVSFVSSSQLRATSPPHPAGSVPIQVTNPDGQSQSYNSFAYVSPTTSDITSECSARRPEWIFCDDFETDRLLQYFEYVSDGGSFVRVSGIGVNGSTGMRARFAVGQVSAGNLKLAFGRTPAAYFRAVDSGTANHREVFWRFYLRTQPDWTGGGGDKLSRAMILATANWAQAAIGHLWSGTSPGPDQAFLFLDPASGTDAAGNLRTTTYNDFPNLRWLGAVQGITPIFDPNHTGQWHCIEVRMRLNDPGQSNGIFEFWINDKLEAQRANLNWVGSYQEYGINAIFLENYWNAGSPVSQERYLDNFVVSTQRIGCGSSNSAPGDPTVSGISPASGSVNGGTSVTINGTNFQSGAAVLFGNTAASSVTFVSSTQLRAITPAHTAGTVDVRVTNPDGKFAILEDGFSFLVAESGQGVLFQDDFETGDFSRYFDKASNQIYTSPVHGGQFASRVNAQFSGFGKLMANLSQPADDLWFRAFVYFPVGFTAPCCPWQSGTSAGVHLWRYYNASSGAQLHFDFNIPTGASGIQLAFFSAFAPDIAPSGNWAPAAPENQGRWQCWETRVKLNTPGQSDGIIEFWVDGVRRANYTGLNLRGTSSEVFRVIDVQSNIGGGPHPSTWIPEYWWGIDDVKVSTQQIGCLQ